MEILWVTRVAFLLSKQDEEVLIYTAYSSAFGLAPVIIKRVRFYKK